MAKTQEVVQHDHNGPASAHGHEESTRFYWVLGGILAVVTFAEVVIAEFGEAWFGIPYWFKFVSLIVLSIIKGALVVMYYMHLKGDKKIYQFVFVAPFCIAVSMGLIMLVLFSGHSGIAG